MENFKYYIGGFFLSELGHISYFKNVINYDRSRDEIEKKLIRSKVN